MVFRGYDAAVCVFRIDDLFRKGVLVQQVRKIVHLKDFPELFSVLHGNCVFWSYGFYVPVAGPYFVAPQPLHL